MLIYSFFLFGSYFTFKAVFVITEFSVDSLSMAADLTSCLKYSFL